MSSRCNACDKAFSYSDQLQQHMKTHLWYCQMCQCVLLSFENLQKHFNRAARHSSDPTEMMTNHDSYCIHCRRQFKSSSQLVTHFSQAHELMCHICNKQFGSRNALQQHVSSPAHRPRELPCPHCRRVFKTTSGVAHHLECRCLKKITEIVVQWDEANLITDRHYTNRIREVDSDDSDRTVAIVKTSRQMERILSVLAKQEAWSVAAQAYECPVTNCSRQFRKLHDLNQHLRSQIHRTDPSTFRCPRCSKRFSVVSALIQHLESGACGLAGFKQVNQIYTGLHDIFSRLLK